MLQAINTHPSYATAHENLGDIYAKMASLAYTRALSLDTSNTAAKGKLALIDDLFSASPTALAEVSPVRSPAASVGAVVAAPVVPVAAQTPSPVASRPAIPTVTAPVASPVASPAAIPATVAEVSVDGLLDALQGWV